jgi:hypothetical protein
MAEAGAAIEAVEVTKRFGSGRDEVLALDRVDLPIREGEFFKLRAAAPPRAASPGAPVGGAAVRLLHQGREEKDNPEPPP